MRRRAYSAFRRHRDIIDGQRCATCRRMLALYSLPLAELFICRVNGFWFDPELCMADYHSTRLIDQQFSGRAPTSLDP